LAQRDGSADAVAGSEDDPDSPHRDHVPPATPPFDARLGCPARRACDKPTIELPRCAGLEGAASWEEIRARAESLVGRSIAVRGPLHVHLRTGCTMAGCRFIDCCNDCDAPYVIGADSQPLVLPPTDACRGDESRLCCPWRAEGQTVIAAGVLRDSRKFKGYTWGLGYGLDDAKVCEVRD
jgi:hypothetical protein